MRRGLFFLLMVLCGCSRDPEVEINDNRIAWDSILTRVRTVEGQPFSSSHLFSSSSGSISLTGYSAEMYGDLDHGNFLAVCEIDGGFEATLAEVHGPGAITWIWSANPVGELVLEVDGQKMTHPFQAFLQGGWLPVQRPFAAETAAGFNLHFPIIHKHHCRLSIRVKSRAELGALFYQVAWNRIESNKKLVSFNADAILKQRNVLKQISNHWKRNVPKMREQAVKSRVLPSETVSVFNDEHEGCIQRLEISAGSKKELSALDVAFFWDDHGEASLRTPLHMLCGVSESFEDMSSIPIRVRGSTATVLWPMPYEKGALICVQNKSDQAIEVEVSVSNQKKSGNQVRFCGRFSRHWDLQADSPNVLELADVQGSGEIVGCILQVDNRSSGWWGEGDPIISLDGKTAWRGTGTEDYFGFAWCSENRFQHPLRGQSRTAVLYRYHLLDTLPFSRGARFEFEAHGLGEGLMDYSALVLWYSAIPSTNADTVLK